MKSTLYIKHDMYALDDDLIEALVDRYREAGYGIWWAIVEKLTIAETHSLRLDELVRKVDKALAVKKKSITASVIAYCIELGLLVEQDGQIYNERIIRQCAQVDEISRKNAENVKIRWENARKQKALEEGNTTVLEPLNEGNTNKDKDKNQDKDKKKEYTDYVVETYRSVCSGKFNFIKSLSETRKSHCFALVDKFGKEAVKEGLEKASNSSFLTGNNGAGWQATFDWLILPSNFIKVLEGNYDDKKPAKALPKSSVCTAGAFDGQKNAEGGFDL
jgi:hypothetical protein